MSSEPMEGLNLTNLAVQAGTFGVNVAKQCVAPGQILAVVGPSGCGKTTLLHAISGMRRCSGKVMIDADDVTTVPPERRPTALVFQSPVLFPGLSVRENIGYGLDDARTLASKRDDLIDIAMANLNITALADKKPAVLSGGQSQRVALARTLVRRPKVLLLDEPLSHVEPPLRREIRRDIVAQVRRARLAAVYVTHDLEEAFMVGDQIAVMESGRIVQTGTPMEVYRSPASRFVADLLGQKNILAAMVLASGEVARVRLGAIDYEIPARPTVPIGPSAVVLPPEAIVLEPAPAASEILGNLGQIIESSFAGAWSVAEVETDIGTLVVHEWDVDEPRRVGDFVRFTLRHGRGWVIPGGSPLSR